MRTLCRDLMRWGVRYYFTEHIAIFSEDKYNAYSVNHIVGGLSFYY